MAMKECPGCALEVDRGAKVCPYCQYEFPQSAGTFKIVAWIMLALFLYPLYLLARRILAAILS